MHSKGITKHININFLDKKFDKVWQIKYFMGYYGPLLHKLKFLFNKCGQNKTTVSKVIQNLLNAYKYRGSRAL